MQDVEKIAEGLTEAMRTVIYDLKDGRSREYALGATGFALIRRGLVFVNELGERHLTKEGRHVISVLSRGETTGTERRVGKSPLLGFGYGTATTTRQPTQSDIERLTSPPRLKSEEWAAFIKKAKIKKQDIARMLCVEPETLSRILKGKACSVATEKVFRLIMVCKLTQHETDKDGQFARTIEQGVALKTICSLELKYLELVK